MLARLEQHLREREEALERWAGENAGRSEELDERERQLNGRALEIELAEKAALDAKQACDRDVERFQNEATVQEIANRRRAAELARRERTVAAREAEADALRGELDAARKEIARLRARLEAVEEWAEGQVNRREDHGD